MQGSETKHEIDGVDADDLGPGTVPQYTERDAVVRVVEGRNDDGRVAYVEIRIARRQTLTVEEQRPGIGSGTTSGLEPSSSRKSRTRSQFSASATIVDVTLDSLL